MDNPEVDYDDPQIMARWANERRNEVIEYLENEGIAHAGVGEEPDFCMAPYVSVWRVMSGKHPEQIGFWAICGDLPTDYVSSNDAKNAREVLAHFSHNWAEVAACMKAGRKHPTITIGPPESWPELAPMLEVRAKLLGDIADDEDVWSEEE